MSDKKQPGRRITNYAGEMFAAANEWEHKRDPAPLAQLLDQVYRDGKHDSGMTRNDLIGVGMILAAILIAIFLFNR